LSIGPFEETKALVLVTASGHAEYEGPVASAGIILIITLDGTQVSEALSFEGESSKIFYRASTSFNFLLQEGNIANVAAQVFPTGPGGEKNKQAAVSLQCFALATET
jgi:hypothetical protein